MAQMKRERLMHGIQSAYNELAKMYDDFIADFYEDFYILV